MDILNGNIWKNLIKFALPLAMTSMLQQIFNAADVAIVGQFVGKHAMAAVGSNGPIIGLLVNLFVGVSIGANVVIARNIGENRSDRISDAVHTSVVLSVICGLIIAVIGLAIAKPMTLLLDVPDEIAPMAVKYMRIYFAGMPVIMMYNFLSAIFRSKGDTRTPLIILATAGATNVVLNLFFVIVVGMDVDGVALATVLSNAFSAVLLFRNLRKDTGDTHVEYSKLKIHRDILITILKIGIPSGMQGIVFSLSNLVVQSAINSLGADIVAASAASVYIEIFVFFLMNSFGQACVTFIGQCYGAGNTKRCDRVIVTAAILNTIVTMSICVLLIIWGHEVLSIFNGDPVVINYGYTRLMKFLPFEWINCIMEVVSGTMRGLGRSAIPAMVTFFGVCGTRIIWVFTVFAANRTLETLMTVYPISWAISTVVLVILLRDVRKKAYEKYTTI